MSYESLSFRGLMSPVFTPFHQNKNINYDIIPEYAKYLHSHGISGVLVNGTTGEGVSLTVEERMNVLQAWVRACKPYEQTIMVQVGGTNLEDIKKLAKHAAQLKVSSILCLADLFFKPSSVDDLVRYLKTVSDAAPETPLLYYHIPGFTGINLNMVTLMEKSFQIPTFAGIKFTDTDLVMGSTCVNLNKHTVFLGCDTLLLPALLQGFDSAIGTTINIFPDENNRILRYFRESNFKSAIASQRLLNENIELITKQGSWVSSMKAAMRTLTPIDVGPVRDPLLDTDIEEQNLDLIVQNKRY